jgi:ABC-type sugar transport system substrate-binding protein
LGYGFGGVLALLLSGVLAAPPAARADEPQISKSERELRSAYDKDTQGKTIAWVPIALGAPITDEWTYVFKKEAEERGMKFVLRDPNWDATAELQAVSALISEKPEIMIVHNPSLTLLAKELKRAEEAGIHVIQMNMESNYISDGFVGADWGQIGRMMGEEAIKACGSASQTSHKVQIVQGELTAAGNVNTVAGLMQALDKDKSIKVVSSQAANWDPKKALDITQTVIQQHPDLCASIGIWGVMETGASQAIKNAGKLAQVKIITNGEGSAFDCDQLNQGMYTKYLSYHADRQAHDVINQASLMLQSKLKPGSTHLALYTVPEWLDKASASKAGACFELPNVPKPETAAKQ